MVSVVSVIHIVTFVDTRFSVCSRSSHHHHDWATTALLGEVKPCYQLRVVEAALMIRMEEEGPPSTLCLGHTITHYHLGRDVLETSSSSAPQ